MWRVADDPCRRIGAVNWLGSSPSRPWRRDFVDLRDRTGITQVVFDPKIDGEAHKVANQIRSEFVLAVSGTVRERLQGDLLFSLELGHGTDLAAVYSIEKLRDAFKVNEHPLSQNIEILNRGEFNRWLIADKTSKRSYVIKFTSTKVMVYLGTINLNLPTGDIEVASRSLEI